MLKVEYDTNYRLEGRFDHLEICFCIFEFSEYPYRAVVTEIGSDEIVDVKAAETPERLADLVDACFLFTCEIPEVG